MHRLDLLNSLPESLLSEPLLLSNASPSHIMIQQQQLQDRTFSFDPQFQNQTSHTQ
jgi:hypothetical protein